MSGPRIQLEGAKERPFQFSDEVLALPVETFGEPLLSLSPISMSGEVTAMDDEYLLDATLSYSGELECGRCLAAYPFEQRQAVQLRLRERPAAPPAPKPVRPGRPTAPPEEEVELSGDDLDVVFFDEPVLPFEDVAREQILIAIPMKPLCREDCRGLCPNCGTDLNVGTCACSEKAVDPRLEVLKNFK
ncbi:MAG: YceD family protein [Thermoanaerobaculia bacterium]